MLRDNFYRLLKHISCGRLKIYFNMMYARKYNNIYIYDVDGKCKSVRRVDGIDIRFLGRNSVVKIYKPYKFNNCYFEIGDDNLIEIKSTEHDISNLRIPCRMSKNSKLYIGKNVSIVGAEILLHDEPERIVRIGDNCMLSFGITIWPSDGHSILNSKGKIINNPKNITIGNNVWVGTQCLILKGANIPNGSILGARTLYTSASNPDDYNKPYIFGGHPAKVLKSGDFTWDRNNTYYFNKKDYK